MEQDQTQITFSTDKNKKYNKVLRIAVYVLTAAVIIAVSLGIWWLNNERVTLEKANSELQSQVVSLQSQIDSLQNIGKPQISEEELSEAKSVEKCFKENEYSTYLQGRTMDSISLSPNQLAASQEGTTYYARWEQLPKVVDRSCEELELTDLATGDTLNLYIADRELIGIQKIE